MPVSSTALHIIGYLGLGLILSATLTAFEVPRLRRIVTAVVILAIYAAVDEATQPFFNRHASLQDWLADMLGSAVAITLWESGCVLIKRLRRRTA